MIVLDTHVLIWWVSGLVRLSPRARRMLDASTRDSPAIVSAISVFEVATAVRRGRLALDVPLDQWLADVGVLPELRFEPVTPEIARLAAAFDDATPGDPADRIIVATARSLDARLVTADETLRRSPHVEAVW